MPKNKIPLYAKLHESNIKITEDFLNIKDAGSNVHKKTKNIIKELSKHTKDCLDLNKDIKDLKHQLSKLDESYYCNLIRSIFAIQCKLTHTVEIAKSQQHLLELEN